MGGGTGEFTIGDAFHPTLQDTSQMKLSSNSSYQFSIYFQKWIKNFICQKTGYNKSHNGTKVSNCRNNRPNTSLLFVINILPIHL